MSGEIYDDREDPMVEAVKSEGKAAFLYGYLEGVRMYAVWNSGVQEVGVMRRPFPEVMARIKAGEDEAFNGVRAVYEAELRERLR